MARITETHKAETKAQIIEVATKYFATIGFDQTKTKAIAKACGIAEGTLFNYFATKDELLVAVFQYLAEEAKHTEIKALPHPKDIIISFVLNYTKKLNIISKSLFIDLIVVSLRLGRKKPKLMQKFIALDMALIASLKEKIEQYYDLSDVLIDASALAEMIYTTVAGDYLFYLYDPNKTYEAYEQSVTQKLTTVLKSIPMEVSK